MKVSIIGCGVYSLALAKIADENRCQVVMWSENESLVKQYEEQHNLEPYFKTKLSKDVQITNDFKECLYQTDLIIIATSSKYVRSVCQGMKSYYKSIMTVAIVSKGLEDGTSKFLSDVVREELRARHIVVLSGPAFASDIENHIPCGLSYVGTDKRGARTLAYAISNHYITLDYNHDIYGTQICGAIKNVIAIGAGILEGAGCNHATQAVLLTKSVKEIRKFLKELNYNPDTVLTYAGIGDLVLTSTNKESRNYELGILIGKKASSRTINSFLKNNTVEGYDNIINIRNLALSHKTRIDVLNHIYYVTYKGKDPQDLIDYLV